MARDKRQIDQIAVGDLTDHPFVSGIVRDFKPDAIVHYGEQAQRAIFDDRPAPFGAYPGEQYCRHAECRLRDSRALPECHLVKLGTMGEYGTPNIDIEEGFIEITHNGRTDTLPYPKQPGSFYHLSKVTTRTTSMFACKIWGIRSTDLNQGVVYGIETDETMLDERLATRFDYDGIWGTVLNRFLYRGRRWERPLTVLRQGRADARLPEYSRHDAMYRNRHREAGQARRISRVQPVHRAVLGRELADMVQAAAKHKGREVEIQHLADPRVEAEVHYYNAKHTKLIDLGLKPRLLSDTLIDSVLDKVEKYKHRVKKDRIEALVNWRNISNAVGYGSVTSKEEEPEPEAKPKPRISRAR